MKCLTSAVALACLAFGSLAGPADAQAPSPYGNPYATPYGGMPGRPMFNPYSGPAVSPYLNLLRPGNPAVNYLGLVRPQQTLYDTTRLAQQTYANQQALAGMQQATSPYSNMPVMTGVQAQFMNQTSWFMNVNRFQPLGPAATTAPKMGSGQMQQPQVGPKPASGHGR